MIEIVIATCNRPEMLRTALKSVAAQTIRSRIGSVIVSENGGNKESAKVCAEFTSLPINYIFRDPPLSAMEHARILSLRETTEKYTAILHDDDWWCPNHLESAFYNLEKAPYASVYHSGVFEVNGESSVLRCDNNFCFWFGSGYSPITSVWDLSEKQVILSCLLHTPARYSSLVAKADFLKSAIEEVLATGNTFDNDRMLTIKLSQGGNVLYNPIPQVFVRSHSTQDQWTYVQNDRIELTAKTTEWIVAQSGENPIDLARRFVSCVRRCPKESLTELISRLLQPWCLPRLAAKLRNTDFEILFKLLQANLKNQPNSQVVVPEFLEKTKADNGELVSICIPTYNGEEYLAETLRSAIAQTYPQIEILLSDDGSTDRTIQIAEEILKDSPLPVRVLKHAQLGLVGNWNYCISEAKGKYIKFLFQDDLLEQNCVQELVALAESDEQIGMVFSRRNIILDGYVASEDWKKVNWGYVDLFKHWSKLSRIQSGIKLLSDPKLLAEPINKIGEPTTVLLRKSAFENVGLFDESLRQVVDIEMWLRLMTKYKVGFVDKYLSSFRIHEKQATQSNAKAGIIRNEYRRFFTILINSGHFQCLSESNRKHASVLLEKFGGQLLEENKIEIIVKKRREIALKLLNLAPLDLQSFLGSSEGKDWVTLLDSGVSEVLPEADDREILSMIQEGFSNPKIPNIEALATIMLYQPAYCAKSAIDLDALPSWFRPHFLKYIFRSPEILGHRNVAEAYSSHLSAWLKEAHQRIMSDPQGVISLELAGEAAHLVNLIPSYCSPETNRELMELRARVVEFTLENSGLKLHVPAQPKVPRRSGQKIRVGVVNLHFGMQTETFVTLPVLHLDKARFEVHLFYAVKNPGPLEDRCRSLAKGFHLLPESIQARVQMIRNAKLDVLIIGTNITAVTNEIALLAAFRMAPIQVVSHCSPMTSGFKNSDAFLSGSLAYREGVSEAEFSEKLILLDGPPVCLDYSCEPTALGLVPPERSQLGIPADALVFFNAASCYKIPLELLHLWARLLKEVPNSVLCLLPFNPNWASKLPETRFRALLESVLAEHGVDKKRVGLGPALPSRAAVMNFERLADVYLDTLPFAGSISTVDPLQLGIPVVACDGETTRSRCSGAQLRELGLDELVGQNEEEYFAKALHLARDQEYRSGISSRINQAMRKRPRFLNPEEYGWNLGNALELLVEEGLGALEDPKAFAQKVRERCSNSSGDSQSDSAVAEITISDARTAFTEGRLSDAEDICREILAKDERCAGGWHLMGKMAALQGDSEIAGEFASVACELDPQNAEFVRELAEVFLRKKELEPAEQQVRRSLEMASESPEGHVLLARILAERDDKHAALEAFQDALRIRKDYAEGFSHYALALQKFGRGKDAISQIRKACALEPDSVEFQTNLAILLEQNARYVDALAAYGKAARMNPNVGFVWFRQGKLLNGLKRYAESIPALEKSISLPGQLGDYYYEYGLALHMTKRFQEAIVHYEKALSMGYETAALHCNRGVIYKDLRKGGDSIMAFHKAVTMDPSNVSYLNNLGAAALELGLNTEALECFEQAVEKNPKLPTARNNIGNLLKDRARGMDALPQYRKSMELNPDDRDAPSNYLLCHMYIPDMDPKLVFEEHKKWGISTTKKFPPAFKFKPREAGAKIRVGFLSADLCHHPVAHFIEPIFRGYDRERFEFVAYGDQRKSDEFSARFAKQVDLWRETSSYDDRALAKLIHEDRVDILFELAGHTAYNRLGVFALKPAPVQVSYLGYPGTTGLPTIDFRITDAFADPQGTTEHLHTEKLIRVPECAWCFEPDASAPEVEPLPALKNGFVTFGCFNNMAKLNPALFETWAEILLRVPGSHLRLKARTLTDDGVRKELKSYFTERGIEEDRLDFFGHTKKIADHLNHYHSVDIALDSFPYHGTTTTCEAMWMGCPVVTRAGKTHVSRVGVSLLNAVGLQEFITETREAYIEKAVALAAHTDRLQELRAGMRERMRQSVLMDEKRFVQGFEKALMEMANLGGLMRL
jgi:predicted O-linked N-acetylglucosamine transferase (SPINDLY family)/glycosyltransferase involved in cell wall biosynthesis